MLLWIITVMISLLWPYLVKTPHITNLQSDVYKSKILFAVNWLMTSQTIYDKHVSSLEKCDVLVMYTQNNYMNNT